MRKTLVGLALSTSLSFSFAVHAGDHEDKARDLLAKLISIKTYAGTGETKTAANFLSSKFKEAGIPEKDITRVDHGGDISSLVVRYRGKNSGKRPIIIMAHMDVVPANKDDWSMEPFTLTEKDGILYGRGTQDNKGGVATTASTIMKFAKEGFVPDRDLILVYTSDEETGSRSIKDLLKNHKDLIDAEYALNSDAGGGAIIKGTPVSYSLQASEKTYQSYKLTVTNSGGHSSVPRADNAIYELVNGLQKISRYKFPVELNPVSAGYFKAMAKVSPAPIADAMRKIALDPTDDKAALKLSKTSDFYNAVMRTTCIATMLDAGHAENALPQSAVATVNCRVAPTSKPDKVLQTLNRIVNNSNIKIVPVKAAVESDPSPLRPEILQALEETLIQTWGAMPIVPSMSTGATDGLYVRNAGIPVYGISGLFNDEKDGNAHGKDEHIRLESFNKALEHWDIFLKKLTGGK